MLENAIPQPQRLIPRSGLGTSQGQVPKVLLELSKLRIVEEPFMLIYSLRRSRRIESDTAIENWLKAQHLAQPSDANGLAGDSNLGCCRTEPNAWLVTAQTPLTILPPAPGLMVTAVSDRLAAFRVVGSSARDLFSAGFDPAPLQKGRAMRTRMASFATVLVQQWDEADFRLLVDVGLARACASWLSETGKVIHAYARGRIEPFDYFPVGP